MLEAVVADTRKSPTFRAFSPPATQGRFQPCNPFAIVSYVRSNQGTSCCTLRRGLGNLVPASKDEKLRKGVSISLLHLLRGYGGILFYDAPPPEPYLLQVIWDKALPILVKEGFFSGTHAGSSSSSKREREILVTADELTRVLVNNFSMHQFSPNLPENPTKETVRDALDKLASCGLAEHRDGSHYAVMYQRLKPNTLDYFLATLVPGDDPSSAE